MTLPRPWTPVDPPRPVRASVSRRPPVDALLIGVDRTPGAPFPMLVEIVEADGVARRFVVALADCATP